MAYQLHQQNAFEKEFIQGETNERTTRKAGRFGKISDHVKSLLQTKNPVKDGGRSVQIFCTAKYSTTDFRPA